MRAHLKTLASPDTGDLRGFLPENPHSFAILIRAGIGVEEVDEFEVFEFLVCSPAWLADNLRPGDFRLGSHLLVTPFYDYERLLKFLHSYCQRCEGPDWLTIARKLQALGRWEFEHQH